MRAYSFRKPPIGGKPTDKTLHCEHFEPRVGDSGRIRSVMVNNVEGGLTIKVDAYDGDEEGNLLEIPLEGRCKLIQNYITVRCATTYCRESNGIDCPIRKITNSSPQDGKMV